MIIFYYSTLLFFLCSLRIVLSMYRCYLKCWRVLFRILFLKHTVCQYHLRDKALCIYMSFLILWTASFLRYQGLSSVFWPISPMMLSECFRFFLRFLTIPVPFPILWGLFLAHLLQLILLSPACSTGFSGFFLVHILFFFLFLCLFFFCSLVRSKNFFYFFYFHSVVS